jgi:epoxyqueuosine reductase
MLTADLIKQKAHELGFDLCGIAPAEPFSELSFLREWLDRGYAGDMDYLARTADRRADVRAVLPGALSVIVTGTIYNTDRPYTTDTGPDSGGGAGDVALIARYAWGDDYHAVLEARLEALLAWMRQVSTDAFEGRVYVDTGPVQERVFAQYAGLGWVGKNTCLINPELGSWFFLAEIICTLPLDTDTQGLEQCGSCTQCLDACPTGALVEAGVLDATRCLSYLTIETRGGIPEEHRTALGARIYGCDICQEVCPYNQAPPVSADPRWQRRAALDLPRLVDLWRRPDRELRRMLKGSAMTRAPLAGLRRNLAVAIGNSGDVDAIVALAAECDERPSADNDMVVDHIRWAVTRACDER